MGRVKGVGNAGGWDVMGGWGGGKKVGEGDDGAGTGVVVAAGA